MAIIFRVSEVFFFYRIQGWILTTDAKVITRGRYSQVCLSVNCPSVHVNPPRVILILPKMPIRVLVLPGWIGDAVTATDFALLPAGRSLFTKIHRGTLTDGQALHVQHAQLLLGAGHFLTNLICNKYAKQLLITAYWTH